VALMQSAVWRRMVWTLVALIGVALLLRAASLQKDLDQAGPQEARTLARSVNVCVTTLSQDARYQAWSWDAVQGRCAARVLEGAQHTVSARVDMTDQGP